MLRRVQGPGLANASDIEDAEAFAKRLTGEGFAAAAIHSRQSGHVRRKLLCDLRDGALRCLVHVNLLTEGANYPWLQWLLLRREVGSRVRFVQEIGRLLRSHPGKTEAVFLDPHDLFGSFDVTYAEALGEPPPRPDYETAAQQPALAAERIGTAEQAIAMHWAESLVRALTVACDSVGLLRGRKVIAKAERLRPANALQVAALSGALARCDGDVPADWGACLAAILARPETLRHGFAADLLCCLQGVAARRRWPPIDGDGRITSAPIPTTVERGGQRVADFARLEVRR
jgi:hypothetical protein